MLLTLGAIFILLLLSAFFSGSETALTAASRPLMHQLERDGDRRAGMINYLHGHRERLIGTILLGNNLVNILASALATSLLITYYGESGVVYATMAMTLLILIFAEILPKTYAIRNANQASLAIAPLVRVLVFIMAPLTKAINFLVSGLLSLLGLDYNAEDAFASSSEELRGAIALHDAADRDTDRERAMLRSVLDLNDVQVSEIMVHRKDVAMIDADQSPDKIVEQVLASPYTRIPLWRGQPENIVGVLHVKALLRAVQEHDGTGELDIVKQAAEPWFIPEQTSLLSQLQEFRHRHEHFALMVDEYGSFMGIVTLEDILEEIVGDISDEHDLAKLGVIHEPDGSYLIKGGVTLRDLNRQFGWNLPDEEAATLAGLILHESRRIPEPGQIFLFHGLRIEILQRQRHQITLVKILPLPGANDKNAPETSASGK
ncbi:MAG: HlyC/CorC family transporter [Rhodospirillaceae bacterium]|nr:HlyC/CorC family transporter [Rhodospirillaceae bacterium]